VHNQPMLAVHNHVMLTVHNVAILHTNNPDSGGPRLLDSSSWFLSSSTGS